MQTLKISLLVFILSINSFTQQGWFSINRIPEGKDFNSVFFENDTMGYTVTNEGLVFRTSDRGNSWSVKSIAHESLNDVFFTNSVGYIAGNNGKVFRSINGEEWIQLNSEINNDLLAIYFVDEQNGYAFGKQSTIIKTTNMGENWTRLNVSSSFTITDGAFPTPEFGFCTTSDGFLLRTLDYGASWQYLPYSLDDAFYSVVFVDSNTAYITGWEFDLGFLLKTTNRGESFEHLYPQSVSVLNSSYFFSPDTGYVVGNGFISKTNDGGNTWLMQEINTFKNLYDVFFPIHSYGFVCGEDSTMLVTTDGGENWEFRGSGHTIQLFDVYFPTMNLGYAVGIDGHIFRTSNAGNNWIGLNSNTDATLEFVYFLDDQKGFAGGMSGELLSTSNGGDEWIVEDFTSQGVGGMSSISFFENRLGVICGGNYLLFSSDGGLNWSVSYASIFALDVVFLDSSKLISVGGNGAIFKSTDMGTTWSQKNSGTNQTLAKAYFLDPITGFAVGWDGTILITSDSGENWSSINSLTDETLWDIEFVDDSVGYIVGRDGVILCTTNKGLNWSFQNSTTDEYLNAVFFTDKLTGYIVGNSGTMLKTLNGGITDVPEINYSLPDKFILSQNYPNPFNPSTKIKFTIPSSDNPLLGGARGGLVTLKVYDVLGREVATLVNQEKPAGEYEVEFDGSSLTSGIYFYQLKAGEFSETKKMILLK